MAYTRGNLAVQERQKETQRVRLSREDKSRQTSFPASAKRKAVVFAVRGICGCRHGCHWHESCSFL